MWTTLTAQPHEFLNRTKTVDFVTNSVNFECDFDLVSVDFCFVLIQFLSLILLDSCHSP